MITLRAKEIGIPDQGKRIDEHLRRIEPIVEFKGEKSYIRHCDPRKVSYIWDAKPAGKADEMTPICKLVTYHSYGAPNLFKPSIAEVVAQIPESIISRVIAFEMIKSPQEAKDLNHENKALNKGYHVATVVLYGKLGESEVTIDDIPAEAGCLQLSAATS